MRLTVLVAIVASLVLAAASPAGSSGGASVGSKDADFCAATAKLATEATLPAAGEALDEEAIAATADAIREAAKSAPKKIRKAMKRIARTYDRLGKGESVAVVLADESEAFGKASAVYSVYYTKHCTEQPNA